MAKEAKKESKKESAQAKSKISTKTVNKKSQKIKTPKKETLKENNKQKTETPKTTQKKESKQKSGNSAIITLLVLTLIVSGTSLGFSIYNLTRKNNNTYNFNNAAQFAEGSISDVASKVSESVVSIITETRQSSWYGTTSSSAAGTGMIVSADGYILTNKHVADGAKNFRVILDDGTTYNNVSLVGTDPLNDVAFLKIKDVSDLKPVTLGDSKTLSIGQQVIAIGNALGQYQNSVSSGIISGTGRSIIAGDGTSYGSYEQLTDMIQTDAAINSGNSGGPLVNAAGEVIGINTATSANGESIGFAIPISSIKGMLKSVLEHKTAERAYIGVSYISVTNDVKETYELDTNYGAYLAESGSVISGSPAEKAGLKQGDIITMINGVNIGKAGSLSTLIGEYTVGDTIEIKYRRDGQEYTTNITLESYKTTGQRS